MGMQTQRDLTAAERAELDALNQAVTDAIQKRTEWLDAKMVETSRLKVGDDIYDTRSGRRLGKVSKLYRYHAEQDELYDNSYCCDYEYEYDTRCFSNTSSQIGLCYGTREDARRNHAWMAERLK